MRNEIIVMQVLRVPPMGKLVVDVNKQRYENWGEVTDENIRRLLLAAVGELVGFVGGYENLVNAGVAPPAAAGTAGPARPAAPAVPSEREQAVFLASLEAERDTLEAARTPAQPSVLGGVRPRAVRPAAERGEPSIVEQIDAILQRHLVADAELANRSIHLEQDPSGSLRIRVDGRYFQRPADIEETKIQVYIKRALQEWESS